MDTISELVDGGIDDLVLAALSVVSIAGVLLFIDPPLALVALVSFPFLLWLSNWFRHASARAYRRTREAVALVIVHFVESLGGIRAVQAFRREARNQEIFEAVDDDYRKANLAAARLISIFGPTIKLIGNITIAVVLTYGAYRALHGQIGPEVLAAFLLYLRRFFEPMQELSQFYNALQSATAALEKLSGVLQEQPDVPEPGAPKALPVRHGEVTFTSVTFAYRKDRTVLHTLDLRVPAGQTVALVGATGAGKSTVAKLVSRFYDPVDGTVRLDGVDLRDLTDHDLRRAVVMVTQENFLFSGTIAENIAFGKPDATRAEIEAAAAAIGADTFIRALPEGYDTDVRKRGGRLSAGQRQLVAFARGFLADPAVLILDEATSSLDIPSERLVQRALRTILADRTAFVIAHRLSTVEIADRGLHLEADLGRAAAEREMPDQVPPLPVGRRVERVRPVHPADPQPDHPAVHGEAVGVVRAAPGHHRHDHRLPLRGVLEAELGPGLLALPDEQRAGVVGAGEADLDPGRELEVPVRGRAQQPRSVHRWRAGARVHEQVGARPGRPDQGVRIDERPLGTGRTERGTGD
jgi:ABC-type multidrug transport system fused ATPase/permease subunit